jgi:methylglutaconyl-CoA hydratase
MAVAADHAEFSLSEVKVGLVPATVGPFVMRAIGEHAARRYFLTGERFGAQRARELGLVGEVVPAERLDDAVDELVQDLLANSPRAMAAAKSLVAEEAGRLLDADQSERTSQLIARLRVSVEGQEGLRAFLEKRTPSWRQ